MLLINLILIFPQVTLNVFRNPYIISVFFVNIRHVSVKTQESYCLPQPVRLSIANSNFPNANIKSLTYWCPQDMLKHLIPIIIQNSFPNAAVRTNIIL